MNNRFRFKNLRTRLAFWFSMVTMLCLVAVVTILYFQRAAVMRDREFEKLQVVRDLKVRELSRWLEGRMGDLQVAAGDEEIRGLEEILIGTKDDWTPENLKTVSIARSLLQRLVENYDAYHELFIIDTTRARVVISTDISREDRYKGEDPYFAEPKRTGKPFIKDIYDSKSEGKPAMTFSVPVTCLAHEGEHLIGVLVARSAPENFLYPLLQDRTGEGETGETLVVNKDVVAVNELRWHPDAPLKLKIGAEPAVEAATGKTGIAETKDYRGEMVLAAYTHIPMMKWGFVTKRDLTEVYRPITVMRRDMAILVLISLFSVVLVSFVLAGTISRPLLLIGSMVRRFSEGDLEARCPTEGSDEVAVLGASFNNMAVALGSQMTIQQQGAEIADTMVAASDIDQFASGLLMTLIEISGSHLGAFYGRSENGQSFETIASIGLSAEMAQSFSAGGQEGELGHVLATRKPSIIQDIPADTVFTFKTTGGTAIPRAILTIPLVVEGETMAVVSLATLTSYSDAHRQILEQAHVGMNTAMANLLANQKTHALAEELTNRNSELHEQARELKDQAAELEAQRLQVQKADRLKSEFLSNMSHELRTPLNSVITLSELMLSRGPGKKPEKDEEYLRIIQHNGYNLLSLINNILDLSKIEAGRMELSLTNFGANCPLERAVETTRPLAVEKGLDLAVRVDDVSTLYSDKEKIYQVLLNLLSNAVKFTETGVITVSVHCEDERIAFSVQDTGIGIAASERENIFDEFRQVDGSTTRQHEGTGLGLAICRRLALLLGGEISVESIPGEGSTFALSLPLRFPEPEARSLELRASSALLTGKHVSPSPVSTGQTVLVVDDEPGVCELLSGFLVASGYEVVTTQDGAEALRLAEELHPFAITLDVLMPNMDGWEVLAKLKGSESTADIPVIVVSVSEDRATGNALGATAFVVKPITKELLLAEFDRLSRWRTIRNVLVVDDDATVREYFSTVLRERGYQTVAVPSGEEALASVSSYRPDAIVLDLMMPGVDGFEVLSRLREDPATYDLPVVVVTAKDLTPHEQHSLAETSERVIGKGVMEKDRLLQELETTLIQLASRNLAREGENKPLVLVVEDNEVAALQVRTALEESGFEVTVAPGGAEALATFSQRLPDAVVLDLMMPKVDGFEVLERIRATPWTSRLPVLVLTAKELTREDHARLTHNDVQELVQKGAVQRDALVDHVWRMVANRTSGTASKSSSEEVVEPASTPSDEEARPKAPAEGAVVLIVEDNPDNMFTVKEILNTMSIGYEQAENGREAVDMAKRIKPTLILMDIQLPVMSGLDATREIRNADEVSKTPIIAMTAKAMKGDKEEILAAGCDAYISKPLAAEEIMELIRQWIK